MKKAICSFMSMLAIVLVIAMVSGVASAQTVITIGLTPIPGSDDTFTTNYFSNNGLAGAPHGTLRVTNDGSSESDLCANVYVFDDSQEFKECCSCAITPNGMRTWDINTDLNANPANGRVANQGVIQIFSTHANGANGPCDPTFGFNVFSGSPATVNLQPELESFATHVQLSNLPRTRPTPVIAPAYSLTETESIEEEMSGDELRTLVLQCAFNTAGASQGQGSGSGTGVCGCGFEL